MTTFGKIAAVLVLTLTIAACSTGHAQRESVVYGDKTFSRAQSK